MRDSALLDSTPDRPAPDRPVPSRPVPSDSNGVAASAESSPEASTSLAEQARKLELLHEVSRELVAILDREELLERVAQRAKQLIDYHLFSVLLWNEDSQRLEATHSVRWGGCQSEKFSVAAGEGVVGAAMASRRPVRVDDVRRDPRYINCGDDDVRSELALPLMIQDRVIGVLDVESYRESAFSEENERLLSTLASSIAIALENAALYERVREDERQMATELRTAREMQRFLLPRATPWFPGLQTAVTYCPARHLGGDLYDFLGYGEGRTAIAVGDVAGKGTSAALYGSLAVGMLRGYMAENRCDPSCVLTYLNEELSQLEADKRFLAVTFAVYDHPQRRLTIANAGLPYPLLIRDGRVTEIEVNGVPVGAMAAATYRHLEISLQPDDVVVFTTDGIDEGVSPDGELFGSERVQETLRALHDRPACAIADGLLAASTRHLGAGRQPSDDRTVVALKITD
ncbi:MAG: GAF domain-containing SpoIIE family protein phosphatase [Acidobacteriota bacterium]